MNADAANVVTILTILGAGMAFWASIVPSLRELRRIGMRHT